MTENFHAFTTVNPAVVDVAVRFNRAVAHGFEQLAKQYIDTCRQTLEDGLQAQRRFVGVGNFADLAAIQSQVAQETWQSAWSRSREWSDLSGSVARDVMASFGADGEPLVKAPSQKKAA